VDDRGRLLTIPRHLQDSNRKRHSARFSCLPPGECPNPRAVGGSKAVGEPPFMLALSVWLAIKDAVSAAAEHRFEPEFSLPATRR